MTERAECVSCGARRGLLVVWHWRPAIERPWSGGVQRWPAHLHAQARCFDAAACEARVRHRLDRSKQRGAAIHLYPRPCPVPAPGTCSWCGEPIVLVDAADYRRRARTRHYGDEHETGEPRKCRAAFNGSVVWSARDAVRWRERRDHDGTVACVDCGQVCEDAARNQLAYWEADHDVPLIDGGAHELDNLRCRCGPCHDAKTAREAGERAARRRSTVASALTL